MYIFIKLQLDPENTISADRTPHRATKNIFHRNAGLNALLFLSQGSILLLQLQSYKIFVLV